MTHWLNTTVRASAELSYRSAATFHQPGVAMRLHRLFSTFPCSSLTFNDDQYRPTPDGYHDDLIPYTWLHFSPMALSEDPCQMVRSRTALVTDEGQMRCSTCYAHKAYRGQSVPAMDFTRFLGVKTLIFTFIGSLLKQALYGLDRSSCHVVQRLVDTGGCSFSTDNHQPRSGTV